MEKIRLEKSEIGLVVPLSEARKLISFQLTYMQFPLLDMEKKSESDTHLILKEVSRRWFRENGYLIGRTKAGVKGLKVFSDYFVVNPEGRFEFIECLTGLTGGGKSLIKTLQKKLALAKYAPLWLIVPDRIKLIELGIASTMRVNLLTRTVTEITTRPAATTS